MTSQSVSKIVAVGAHRDSRTQVIL